MIICFALIQALVLFAQSPKEFVCRVIPSENDKAYQMLKSAEIRFREYNYKDQAEDIKAFLAKVGNMGVVIRDDAGKKYVLTSGEKALSDFTTFDIYFAPDHDSQAIVIPELKVSALDDTTYRFLLIELPENYTGKALRVTNELPVQGQNVVIPDFTTSHWEEHYATIDSTYEDQSYFTLSYKYPPAGSPVLLHDNNTDSAYTLLGVNHDFKSVDMSQAEKNPAIKDFLSKWRYMDRSDSELPLNLFISMISKKDPSSHVSHDTNLESIADLFISNELLSTVAADLYITNAGGTSYKTSFREDPYKYLAYKTANVIKNTFRSDPNLSVASVDKSKEFAKVVFESSGRQIQTEWIMENGTWKLYSVEGVGQNVRLKKYGGDSWLNDFYYGDPYLLKIEGSLLVPTENSRDDDRGFDISALLELQFFGAGFFFQQEQLTMEDNGGTGKHRASTFGGVVRIQIPVDVWRFMLIPFVEGRLGFTNVSELFDDKTARLFFGTHYGVDLCFVINEYVAPYVSFSGNSVTYNNSEHSNSFEFSAGLRLLGIFDYTDFWW